MQDFGIDDLVDADHMVRLDDAACSGDEVLTASQTQVSGPKRRCRVKQAKGLAVAPSGKEDSAAQRWRQ